MSRSVRSEASQSLRSACSARGSSSCRPVGQAYIHTVNGATSAWGVATVPEHRGRGIGTAITAFAIRDAPNADLAWLMSTREGRSMYERMGFRHASDWDVWAHT